MHIVKEFDPLKYIINEGNHVVLAHFVVLCENLIIIVLSFYKSLASHGAYFCFFLHLLLSEHVMPLLGRSSREMTGNEVTEMGNVAHGWPPGQPTWCIFLIKIGFSHQIITNCLAR